MALLHIIQPVWYKLLCVLNFKASFWILMNVLPDLDHGFDVDTVLGADLTVSLVNWIKVWLASSSFLCNWDSRRFHIFFY